MSHAADQPNAKPAASSEASCGIQNGALGRVHQEPRCCGLASPYARSDGLAVRTSSWVVHIRTSWSELRPLRLVVRTGVVGPLIDSGRDVMIDVVLGAEPQEPFDDELVSSGSGRARPNASKPPVTVPAVCAAPSRSTNGHATCSRPRDHPAGPVTSRRRCNRACSATLLLSIPRLSCTYRERGGRPRDRQSNLDPRGQDRTGCFD